MKATGSFGIRLIGLLGIALLCEAGAEWKPVGPAGGGEVYSVFVSGSYLFASDFNCVWRSADRGASWTCIQPGIVETRFMEIGDRLIEAGNLLESTDHGITWKSARKGTGRADSIAWYGMLESAFIGRYLVVTTRDGIYRSPDSGATWSRIANLPWAADYQYNQVLAMGPSLIVVNETGYYRSSDSGSRWEKLRSGLPIGIQLQIQTMGRYMIGFDGDSTYRSSDFGVTWQRFHSPYLYTPTLAAGPDLYAIGEGDYASLLMRSADSGATWTETGRIAGNQNPIRSLAFAGDTLFAGTYSQGVYRSFDRGAHFEQTSFPSMSVLSLAADSKGLWAGSYGGGGIFRFDGGTKGWSQPEIAKGIRNINAIALDGKTVFAAEICCALHLSRDGGESWSSPPVQGVETNSVEAVAAKDGALLVAASGCVYRLPDSVSAWQRCVLTLPHKWSSSNSRFLVANDAIFLGDSAGVFRSRDAGAHWDTVNHGLTGEVHLLAAAGGSIYAGGTKGVFRSEDQGDSWTAMNTERTRFKTLAAVGRALFAGNDTGVYVSADEGKNWVLANEGLTVSKSINTLAVYGSNLYAGTRASVWTRPLAELAPEAVGLAGPGPLAARSLALRVLAAERGPSIAFNVPADGPVRLDLYDFSGRKAGTLVNEVLKAGPAEAALDGRGLPPGGYILRLRAAGQENTLKIALTP